MPAPAPRAAPPSNVVDWLRGRGELLGEPRPLGAFGHSWIVAVGGEELVIKRIGAERPADDFVPLFRHVAELGIAPPFVSAIAGPREWHAVFRFVPGRLPPPDDSEWDRLLEQVPATLERVRRSSVVPAFDLLDHWRDVLRDYPFADRAGRELQDALFADEPIGHRLVLAHGDFSPQNLVLSGGELVLIDWEQTGRAPTGFDAGWAIAVVELGAVRGGNATRMLQVLEASTADRRALRWFVRLGFLRMLWRAHTLPLTDLVRVGLVAHLRETITAELAKRPTA